MGGQVVYDDYVALGKCRDRHLLDIGQEHVAVHGAVVDEGRSHAACNYQLYSGKTPSLVFRRFAPRVDLKLSVVTPAYEPFSHLASGLANKLIASLESLSAEFEA